MALSTGIILLGCLHVTLGEECVINNVPEQMAFEKQLRKDLKCGYRIFDPPTGNSSTFSVNVSFAMKQFNFRSDEEILSIKSSIIISWMDDRLKWDPEKYYGIKDTHLSSMSIWTPGFRLFNSADTNELDFYYVLCYVKNTGKVNCVPMVSHAALCSVKLTNWPYDQQECTFEFGARISKWVNFRMNTTSITMVAAEYGSEWFLSDYRQEVNHISEKQLKMTFVLEREASGLAAIVVYPSLILTALSITSLFLDVRRHLRLAIACFSLFGHYNFLMELAETMPKQSANQPKLLFYYRGSLVLTVLIILFTFLLAAVCKLKYKPQNYFISINDFVFGSYGKYFIFPSWDYDDTIENKQFNQDWIEFANIINCVFNVVIIIAYISLYCTLIPKPIPVNY